MKDGVFPVYLVVDTLDVYTAPSASATKIGEIKGVGSKVEVLFQNNTGKGKPSSPCNAKGEYVEDDSGEIWVMLPNVGEYGGWILGRSPKDKEFRLAEAPPANAASSTTPGETPAAPAAVFVASQTKATGITPVLVGIGLLGMYMLYKSGKVK